MKQLLPLIMYHANCTDGFGAAFAAWKSLGDDATYVPVAYGDVTLSRLETDHQFLLNRIVYILDFSFPRDVMNLIFKVATKVVWLDHHKTAFELYGLRPNTEDEQCITERNFENTLVHRHVVILDNNKSGAFLAWEYFRTNDVPAFIKHIDDYDRWQFKIAGTKHFNLALKSYAPWSFQQWDDMFLSPYTSLDKFYADARAFL